MKSMFRAHLLTAAALAMGAGAAGAQAPAQKPTLPKANADGVQEVIVTAQRREERLQKVPIAVSVFSADTLQSKQIADTYDLIRNVPNLAGNMNVGVGTSSSYYLRGLGNGESIATFDVPVGTYVDDVYISRQNANNFALFDVERIEVLRGPQGTLFGRNTTGGAINVILRKPGEARGGYIEGGIGEFERRQLRASIDLPFGSTFLTKFSGFMVKDDGYARQVSTSRQFNSQDSWGLRAAARVLPTPTLTFDFIAEYTSDQNTNFLNVYNKALDERLVNNRIQQGALVGTFTGAKAGYGPDNVAKTAALSANLKWDVGPGTLQSITGWRETKQEFLVDSGGELPRVSSTRGFNPLANQGRHEQVSQEIKYDGETADGRLNYVAGFYYIKEDNFTDFANAATNLTTLAFTVSGDRFMVNTTDAKAVYAQSDFKIVPTLTATLGVRYTDESKTFKIDRNPGAAGAALSTAGIVAAGLPISLNQKEWTPRAALSWSPNDATMLFISATRGFKSGGWPARALANNLFIPFKPEKILSYETGFRANLFDNRLRANVTAFYAMTDDIQIPAQIATTTGPVSTTTNPAGLKNYGLEIEASARPTRNLTIDLAAGLQRARYENIAANVQAQQQRCRTGVVVANLPGCNANFVDRLGNIARPLRSPEYTVNLTGAYRVELPLGDLTPSATVIFTGPYAIGTAGSPNQIDGSWAKETTLYNASLAFRPKGLDHLTVQLECRNCAEKNYPVSFLPPFQFLDRPGTWNLKARVNF
ncbi:MAG: TonB-dependent receptor [Caulobacterales bacterium]